MTSPYPAATVAPKPAAADTRIVGTIAPDHITLDVNRHTNPCLTIGTIELYVVHGGVEGLRDRLVELVQQCDRVLMLMRAAQP